MPNPSLFFRLIDSPIDSKGADLLQQIALQNQGAQPDKTYPANPDVFGSIPGSPFAYWTSPKIRDLFQTLPRLEQDGRVARVGDHPGDQDRYLRLYWEVGSHPLSKDRDWMPYQKGGAYSPYYYDIHLVVDWDKERETYFDFHGRKGRSSEHPSNYELFFRPGLTWPRRTQKGLSVRALPSNCAFADKGPVIFDPKDNSVSLLSLLAVTNSSAFKDLIRLQMVFGSFEVGVLQQTPIPILSSQSIDDLAQSALELHNLVRKLSTFDETTHVFSLSAIVANVKATLSDCIETTEEQETSRQEKIFELQANIDTQIANLFGIEDENKFTKIEDDSSLFGEHSSAITPLSLEEEEEATSSELHPSALVSDLLMWCLGFAFGRWDIRFVLKPDLLPALAGPFDPLPRCSPGMLLSPDGLPVQPGSIVSEAWLRARPNVLALPESVDGPATIADNDYPLPIAWDGILVDDPDHPRDIVAAVRRVLRLVWNEHADAIEQEACRILDVPDLRAYFRDPRLFFNYHIKRYSKSRRKAPIYWMLQSAKRSYAVWLYYPRLNPDLLFRAGREYVDYKTILESDRLAELLSAKFGLSGASLKMREKQMARQADLVEELKPFGKELDRVALLEIKPDLNDGVLLNIAPLHNLVPWKEAEKTWNELVSGKYAWSSIAQQIKGKK